MYKFCVFAGTTEGRELVELLCARDCQVTACVATEYGRTLLPERENLRVSARPLPREEIEALLRQERFDLVIDATHPYAAHITESILAACEATGTEHLRVQRAGDGQSADAVFVADAGEAAAYLDKTEGNILLTTGSKELGRFAGIRDFADRVFARVLPMADSLRACEAAGLAPAHILAMQGPFSAEMNAAMLRTVGAAWLVTKDSGAAGGFEEKAAAARETGARLVVVGRPPQRDGLSFADAAALLERRFGFRFRPRVTVAGIGPGGTAAMTEEVRRALEEADCLIGAARMTAAARPGQTVFTAVAAEKIADYIHAHPEHRRVTVAMSGDTGFFSGAKKLLPLLADCEVRVLPGVSSLSCLCARLGVSYEDAAVVSAHGRELDVAAAVRRHRRLFVLTGGENGVRELCEALTAAGLGRVRVSVGERLGYPEERVSAGTAAELAGRDFQTLSVMLIENEDAGLPGAPGLPDERFRRLEGVPMTKSEVCAVCLSKLSPPEDAVCWDVGAGTGSVSAELGLLSPEGRVYAVERRAEAAELIRENCRELGAGNVTVIAGEAPEVCRELPAPTHAFLGGTGGCMEEIIRLLLEKNPKVRIVATAVTLESASELTACMKRFPFAAAEAVQLSAARSRAAGDYHLMTGQNPVYIFTMQG